MQPTVSPQYLIRQYVFSGVCLGIGFVFPYLWWSGVLGVFLFLRTILQDQSVKFAIFGGFATWTIKSLLVLVWFFSTYPLDWLPFTFGQAAGFFIATFWLYSAAVLGLGGAVCACGLKYTARYVETIWFYILFPTLWVLSEILGSLFFSFFTTGAGGIVGPNFSFGYLGYLLAGQGLLGFGANLGGVYALSFLAAALGLFFWQLSRLKHLYSRRLLVGAIVATLLLAIIPLTSLRLSALVTAHDKTVAVIETDFTAATMRDPNWGAYRSAQLELAVRAALAYEPDYLLLPEDARFVLAGNSAKTAYNQFRFLHSDPDVVLVDTRTISLTETETILRAHIYDGLGKQGLGTDKQLLVPNGEFLPKFTSFVVAALAGEERQDALEKLLTYRPGPLTTQNDFPDYVPGVLFCFESSNPLGVRKLSLERALPFVAHPVSHAMFHQPKILLSQLDAMLQVQAQWNKLPIVSAGNLSRSTLYRADGSLGYPEIVETGEKWRVGLFAL